jgi:formamidopyrimidine-DNA glycosylase
MPEIVEIKKYCDFINKNIKGDTLINIKILNGRYKKHSPFEGYSKLKKKLPLNLLLVQSKGKFIYMTFNSDIYLLNTLGLSGGWVFKQHNQEHYKYPNMIEFLNAKDIENYRDNSMKHLNVEFQFVNGSLFFYDTLSFGTIKVIFDIDLLNKKLSNIGPDIMDINTNVNMFKDAMDKYPDKEIGINLMNQKLVSGIGNYLRSDILWLAKISPFRLTKNISDKEFANIFRLARSITWGDYDLKKGLKMKLIKKTDILPRKYKRDFLVYYEETDIYGNHVVKEELYEGSQKRFIYWCPKIQK